MGQHRSGRKSAVARVVLVGVNAAFLAVGITLLVFTLKLDKSGWLHTVEDTEYDWIRSQAIWWFKVLSGLVMAVALMGLVGAWFRQKCLLSLYALCVLVLFAAFLVCAVLAFVLQYEFHDWQRTNFPAKDAEVAVAQDFNEVYCYALGGYFCNSLSVAKALDILAPNASQQAVEYAHSINGTAGVLALCTNLTERIHGFDTVCKACALVDKSKRVTEVLHWLQDKCPAHLDTTAWCAEFLITGTPGAVYEKSPYRDCRSEFLYIAQKWARQFSWTCLLTSIAAFVLIVLAIAMCCKRRQKELQCHDDAPYTNNLNACA